MPARKPQDNEIDVYGITHTGLRRPVNQDHFLIAVLGRELRVLQTSLQQPLDGLAVLPDLPSNERAAFLAVVADGVGRSANGAEASRLAVEEITSYIARTIHSFYTANPQDDATFRDALDKAAHQTHEQLLQRAGDDPDLAGMATTLTLWLGVWPNAYLLQVGDSRYYLFREGKLTQVSRDQTVAQDLIDSGVLSASHAQQTRWAHVLSSALGGPTNAPTVAQVQNDWSTVHLLCSDGLTKHVTDERIRERLMAMSSAKQVCEDLVQDALDGGGSDNITIVVGRAVKR